MIGTRSKQDNSLITSTWISTAIADTAKEFDILINSMDALFTGYVIQQQTRDLFTCEQISERIGINRRWVAELKERKYIECVGSPLVYYNITTSGEYVVRALLIRLSRLVNDSKLSKARLTRERKKKLSAYMRPANRKGVKLY
jgi:hypothetical protein